ncbi:MAG: response regulator transcription factor [Clostridia bacterium]|nr:response regulator transcription factor [Clostridia bacterium]
MVINVAIVEDEPRAKAELENAIVQYERRSGNAYRVAHFPNAISFLETYKPIYDIVFMDIGLPDIDGMTATEKLRKVDSKVLLIFVTNMAQYAVKGYEVEAFAFLLKPVNYHSLAMKLTRAEDLLSQKKNIDVVVPVEGGIKCIPVCNVFYVEVMGHTVYYHAKEGVFSKRASLSDAEKELKGASFSRCNSCYLVNLDYVRGVKGFMVNIAGEELQISHPRKKLFMRELTEYFGKK